MTVHFRLKMSGCYVSLIALFSFISCQKSAPTSTNVSVSKLTCEYAENLLGIDEVRPRLSWVISSERNGTKQTAYQILVASDVEKLNEQDADRWNSGKLASGQSSLIRYSGNPLTSRDRCYWKVRVWDENDQPSEWSEPAKWTIGLLKSAEWKAAWISSKFAEVSDKRTSFRSEPQAFDASDSAAIYMRKEIALEKAITRATASITGLGYYELYLNGDKVGDHVLDPLFTDYQRTVHFVTYDVTEHLQHGTNAIGVILGNGFYNLPTQDLFQINRANWKTPQKLLFNLLLEYEDGSSNEIVSDTSWTWSKGEIVYNSIRGGETIDMNKKQEGWNKTDFDASNWQPVVTVPAPIGALRTQYMPPLRVTQEFSVESMWSPKANTYVFDFGENMTGWVSMKFKGEKGMTAVLDFNEVLNPDSTLNVKHSSGHTWGRFQKGIFISAGGEEEVYEPRFLYHGFRYVQVSGLPYQPSPDDVVAKSVHNDLQSIGTFQSSNERLNQLHAAVRRTLKNSIHSMPGEEATREKMGWTLDGGMETMESYIMNFDAVNSYRKYLQDLIDSQEDDGHIPPIVPTNGWGFNDGTGPFQWDDPWWGGTIFYVTEKLYRYTGDTSIVADAYASLKAYLEYVYSTAEDDIVSWSLGDWLDLTHGSNGWGPGLTPVPQTSTAANYHFSQTLSEYAQMLGKTEDAKVYADHADRIKQKFNDAFLDRETGWYNPNSQTAQAVPLYLGLVPEDMEEKVYARLIDAIKANDYHTSVGFLGVKPLLRYVADRGDLDIVYRMVTQEESPGWLHFVKDERSTMGENLNAKGYGTSHHPFATNIGFWLYAYLGGIQVFQGKAGFDQIVLKPGVQVDLAWVKTSHDSPKGKIVSNWEKIDNEVRYEVLIPANTMAHLILPSNATNLKVDGDTVDKHEFVTPITGSKQAYQVASGRYTFYFNLNP
ncbi:MAG: family 78 glycoside hydrolase catalytic domain [Bacteroidota bacterium]